MSAHPRPPERPGPLRAIRPGRAPAAALGPALGRSVGDVAQLVGVHPRTVRKAITRGQLAAQRDDAGAWRVSDADAEAYAAAHGPGPGRAAHGPGQAAPTPARAAEGPQLAPLLACLAVALDREASAYELARQRSVETASERELREHAQARTAQLEVVARTLLDGRWRARRRARHDLRHLLNTP